MNTLTAYTPLESLLLFQSLAKYGEEPSAFSKISDLLKGNPLVRQAKTFDTGRLSPDALRELYLSLLKEDSSGEVGRNGALEQPGDEGQSISRKRKLQTPPLPDVAQQAQRLPQLVKRLYARYIENITRLIREDEKKYQSLHQEVEEIQRGELVEELRGPGTSEPATPTNARGDGEQTARQTVPKAPTVIGELDVQMGEEAEIIPGPVQINVSGITEDVNGSIRGESPKSTVPRISPNASPSSPTLIPSLGTAVESLPSPRIPNICSPEQEAKVVEEQENGVAKSPRRSRTPQARIPARPRSAEPRTSSYSRHYVTSTPAVQATNSTYLRTPKQPELTEGLSPDLANSNDTLSISALENAGQPEEHPPTLLEDQNNASLRQGPQIPQLRERDVLGSVPSPAPVQTTAEAETAATVTEVVLSPQARGLIPESLACPTDTVGGQPQAAPATRSDQGGPSVDTPQPMEHSPPPHTPEPPAQDASHPRLNNLHLPAGLTPSPPGTPRTPFSASQVQSHHQPAPLPLALESVPSELNKLNPHDQSPLVNQDEVPSSPLSQPPNAEMMQRLSPRLSAIQTPTLSISARRNLFITPGFSKPRPPPIDTSALTNRSFKPFDRGLISGSPGSPVRPGPDEISPISAPSSPILFSKPTESEPPSTSKGSEKAQRDSSVDAAGRAEEDDTDGLETRKTRSGRTQNATSVKSRRTRAESAASSAVPPSTRARSRSIISHVDELSMDHETVGKRKVKHEQPATPRTPAATSVDKGGETTADEGARPRRGKRKELEDVEEMGPKPKRIGNILGTHYTHSPLQLTPDTCTTPQYVLSTRNFARTSATIMNDIGQHKYASIFSSPVKEKDAPGYKDLIYRPQDLKSIKSAIAAGGKAVAAAVGAVSISGGTHTENSPSPGPVGTAAAKNTSLWIPISREVVPPRGIINSAQLEKELMRMFANAVMFNPGPDRGFGPTFKEKAEGGQEEEEDATEEDEDGGVVKDTREMFAVVERAVTDWRAAERAVESLSGKPPVAGAGLGRPRPGAVGKEKEEDEADEATATTAAAVATDGRTEDKEDGEATPGPARKRRRL